jgi:hypothetical protein
MYLYNHRERARARERERPKDRNTNTDTDRHRQTQRAHTHTHTHTNTHTNIHTSGSIRKLMTRARLGKACLEKSPSEHTNSMVRSADFTCVCVSVFVSSLSFEHTNSIVRSANFNTNTHTTHTPATRGFRDGGWALENGSRLVHCVHGPVPALVPPPALAT